MKKTTMTMRLRPHVWMTSTALILAATLNQGCVTTTEGQGALLGGVVGAGIGALACNNSNRAACAAAGAVVGGGLGYLAGKKVAEEKKKYSNAEDYYDAEIAQITQLNKDLSKKNQDLKNSIKKDQSEYNSLMAKYKKGQVSEQQMAAAKSQLSQKRSANEKYLNDIKQQLAYQQEVLKDMKQQGEASSQQIKKQEAQIAKLQSNVENASQMVAASSSTMHL